MCAEPEVFSQQWQQPISQRKALELIYFLHPHEIHREVPLEVGEVGDPWREEVGVLEAGACQGEDPKEGRRASLEEAPEAVQEEATSRLAAFWAEGVVEEAVTICPEGEEARAA